MRDKAKEYFNELKTSDTTLQGAFNDYVDLLVARLEIPKDIAVRIVTDELVNRYEKQLLLKQLFSKMTLEDVKL